MPSLICPKQQSRRVLIDICLLKCTENDTCEEFREISEEDIRKAKERLKIPIDPEKKKDPPKPKLLPMKASKESEKLYTDILRLKVQINEKWGELGKKLQIYFEKKYYLLHGKTWKEFIAKTFDFKWRYADYLRITSTKCEEVGVTTDQAAEIGIAKMKEVVPVITKENKGKWLKKAKEMTVEKLNAEVRLSLGKITKEEAEKIPQKRIFVLYEEQLPIVDKALELAGLMSDSSKTGYQLELISADFLASYEHWIPPKTELVLKLIERIELMFKVKVGEIVDTETGEIIRGGKSG